ncbi:MAG: YggT family protein [Gammaproteobacteria bacterium]|nr:YggT family protein [Gammaproteobacteria bacterium]
MGGYGTNAIEFLIQTIFGLYLVAVMLRVLLQLVRADFYNPVSQFLVKVTNPPLIPLRRVIPGFMGIDFAAIVLMILIKALEIFLIVLIKGISVNVLGIVVLAIAELLRLLINVYFFSILIQVVISWVNPGTYNPVVSLLYSINEPLLRRARRLIPPISGFDLSPIVVIILLQLVSILLIHPLADLGQGLAVGGF